ncbi:MAG: hypothetical protein RBG1_1C00001G1520 [candidate division Zixibacteria bacterium RBG-1]|nr:MAG: hypothetical protein RBG1_1C00001G1520 [candidate division Zixibacteria bacterium RBG-1]OGC83900.1 MAG: cysteine desulfurase NifS [candidate division Zixibacteria bacterium RBG_19FT_COMBO_42_43]
MPEIYLDYNATAPIHPEVLEAMQPYLTEKFGNPSSLHSFGREAKVAVEEAREKVAKLINAHPSEIYFTSCGSESDNWAIKGILWANKNKGNHIIISKIEHQAVLETCKFLEENGYSVTYLDVDKFGMVDPDNLRKSVRKDTVIVSIMHANNEVGTIQPIEELLKIAKERNVVFHTDAVQSIGKISVDVQKLGVDLLSISGHKLYAPKGIGVLFIKRGTKITSLLQGGNQERSRRAGTENVASIVGLGKACEIAAQDLDEYQDKMKRLSESFLKKILDTIPEVYLSGHPTLRVPNTVNLSFNGCDGESIILGLDLQGVAVSSGSACSIGSLEPSHVLMAMGVPKHLTLGSVRFSFGRFNSMEDVEYVTEILPGIVEKIRNLHPAFAATKNN